VGDGEARVVLIGCGRAGAALHTQLIAVTPGFTLATIVTAHPEPQARVPRAPGRARGRFRRGGPAATVGHQIDLQEAGTGVVPVGKGAHGDLLTQPMAGVRDGGAAHRVLRSRGRQHARERRPTDLPPKFLDRRADRELAPDDEPFQELGNEGLQSMGADPATGLPQYFRGDGDLRALGARPAPWPRSGPNARRKSLDRRFAVKPRHRHDLVQGWCFCARVACWYRNRWTAAYSRKLARVTGPSPWELVTVTSELRSRLR
jgi:hypothetical protein